jgi:hypothetical protein
VSETQQSTYWHHVWCNGDHRYPIGDPRVQKCNCQRWLERDVKGAMENTTEPSPALPIPEAAVRLVQIPEDVYAKLLAAMAGLGVMLQARCSCRFNGDTLLDECGLHAQSRRDAVASVITALRGCRVNWCVEGLAGPDPDGELVYYADVEKVLRGEPLE